MKILKIGAIVLLVIVVGFAGLVFYGLQNIDTLVKSTVERIGTDLMGTKVELATASIELGEGRGELRGLTVANPDGYQTSHAFSLGQIALDLDPNSLLGDVITIEEIIVDQAEITAEERQLQQTNLGELAEHVGNETAATKSGPAAEETGERGLPRLRVERFEFRSSKIHLESSRFGNRTINLPALSATNIGGEQGLEPKALGGALMQIVLNEARDAATAEIQEAAKEQVRSEVNEAIDEKLSDEEKDKLNQLKEALGR